MIGAREAGGATLAAWSSACFSPHRAATARESSAPSRRSSGRWSSTGRRCTCASRSSTTRMSCASWRSAARSSSTRRPRCPRARRSSSRRTASPRRCTRTPRRSACKTIDATCPLVSKVHVEARRYAAQGYTIVLVGHAGHEEVVGTMGEAPDSTVLVQSVEDAEALELPEGTTGRIPDADDALGRRDRPRSSPTLAPPVPGRARAKKEDICYATSNRQWAVKEMLPAIDLLLVIGSRNSSNSNRLVEVARAGGVPAYLIDDEPDIDEALARGRRDRRASPPARRRPSRSSSGCRTGSAAAARRSSRSRWSTRT